uniref:NADH-ubiquinone oxidoreductase chain 4L n=1 Tax=Dastarcus helophoroides TaxID=1169899 RepID=A0A059SX09_9CUCU|nr:NADH dehydrogenase subunit 4L [Dastarcus helophoroides]AHG24987.1 NADH dehydrogenase subunit 4L [Dastarcus helophoroides]
MMIYIYVSMISFLSGILVFSIKRKHLLLMLLSLEFIMLSLFFNLILYLSWMNYEFYFSLIFVSMSVCEGSLGLSILVMMIRSHGSDYFQSFNLLW